MKVLSIRSEEALWKTCPISPQTTKTSCELSCSLLLHRHPWVRPYTTCTTAIISSLSPYFKTFLSLIHYSTASQLSVQNINKSNLLKSFSTFPLSLYPFFGHKKYMVCTVWLLPLSQFHYIPSSLILCVPFWWRWGWGSKGWRMWLLKKKERGRRGGGGELLSRGGYRGVFGEVFEESPVSCLFYSVCWILGHVCFFHYWTFNIAQCLIYNKNIFVNKPMNLF